jgi:hypothetical protein
MRVDELKPAPGSTDGARRTEGPTSPKGTV